MELGSILHRSAFADLYALDSQTVIVNLRTGKDITAVTIHHTDPFDRSNIPQALLMEATWELKHHRIWSISLKPPFKRTQYYFTIRTADEAVLLYADGFCTPEESKNSGRIHQCFKFPWLNDSDIFSVPDWVRDTLWYQIMPDRFCRGSMDPKRFPLRKWEDSKKIHHRDFYGGDLKGIIQKLPYLKELGISGIYMTPVFLSNTNHKYNTFDYSQVDPDFGTEEDLRTLVEHAHALGIRVMLDAVFNHCGTEFPQWQDVVKNGPASPYWDWFFVNQWPLPETGYDTLDSRFYSFAFTTSMPKLNTNNPEVQEFCIQQCRAWIRQWDIDGIRFDVADEVSHSFLKRLRRELKEAKPDIFLLGELWHDSIQWLLGDEFDSSMNYPFLRSLHNFWIGEQSAQELMFALNQCYALYPRQANTALFNLLDTHDTVRAMTRCGSADVFYQQLTLLMTMPGSPCIYYGTEIGLEGGNDPDCRRPMPWHKIAAGACQEAMRSCRTLIEIRNTCPETRGEAVVWHIHDDSRLISYSRPGEKNRQLLTVYLNAEDHPVKIPTSGKLLFSRKLKDGILEKGGTAIFRKER